MPQELQLSPDVRVCFQHSPVDGVTAPAEHEVPGGGGGGGGGGGVCFMAQREKECHRRLGYERGGAHEM